MLHQKEFEHIFFTKLQNLFFLPANVIPFRIGVVVNNAATAAMTGFDLLYSQIPCPASC